MYNINDARTFYDNAVLSCKWASVVAQSGGPATNTMRRWIALAAKINKDIAKECGKRIIYFFPGGYHAEWTIRLHLAAPSLLMVIIGLRKPSRRHATI